ncbi:alpha/beta fold hydrolase [Nocardioides panacisoli]|uniref:esterase/lipase family protein n=1 Tax=Nocardioides panacisoli TaxID=627624 RepID=UPI001C62CD86|nr:alpha/beta fold hydrolase [Nocardioides panacisoli]QYJ04123.1 alpha/beta fold hydrolase [Nocardioides panacisoli]
MRSQLRSVSLLLAIVLGVGAYVAAAAPASAAPPSAQGASSAPQPSLLFGDPPGANDWDCVPTAQRPTPAVLVHGTFGDRRNLLQGLSRDLKDAGFCVYSLDYGLRGTRDIKRSARELRSFVDRVLAATGADRVSLVGHSQGGMMPRYYIKNLGGDGLVEDLVGIAPSNHGTRLVNAFSSLVVGVFCRSCVQQAAGSAFLADLNAGDETPGDVDYTQITTRYDEVVVPHTSGHLTPGPRSTNITLQDLCPRALAEHLLIPTNRGVRSLVVHALTTDGPARSDFRPAC